MRAALRGKGKYVGDGASSRQFIFCDGSKARGGYTAAFGAHGIAAKLAGLDAGSQVGRNARSGLGENAFLRRSRRRQEYVQDGLRHIDFRKASSKVRERGDNFDAIFGPQPLGTVIALLRSKQAEPNLANFLPAGPERREFIEVAGPLHLLPGNRAVHDQAVAGDILENPLIGGRSAARVMFGRQAVDGDYHVEVGNTSPGERNPTNRAR